MVNRAGKAIGVENFGEWLMIRQICKFSLNQNFPMYNIIITGQYNMLH